MTKKIIIFFIAFSFIFSLSVYAADVTNNAGLIPGQIWYSKDSLVEGDLVVIHTAVWNGSKEPLSLKVEFYDKNVILGSRDVTLDALQLKDVSVTWKVTSGDHSISAKIISSESTVSGKKENVALDWSTTENDKQFVSVVVKNDKGEPVAGKSALENQINKTTTEINTIIPEKIRVPVLNIFNIVDNFREENAVKALEIKKTTQKEIVILKKTVASRTPEETLIVKNNIDDATQRPIAYIKLVLFSILAFVLASKIVFYGLVVLVIFYIIRAIYRKF